MTAAHGQSLLACHTRRMPARSWVTRAIQQSHGCRPVAVTCPNCGLSRRPLEEFPSAGVLGFTVLAWAASGRRPPFSASIKCPDCGRELTLTEELERRERRRGRA